MEGMDLKPIKLNKIVLVAVIALAFVANAFADGVVKLDEKTIAVTKTENINLDEIQILIGSYENQIADLQKKSVIFLAEAALLEQEIVKLKNDFIAVGIDPAKKK